MKYSTQLQATIDRGHRMRLAISIICGTVAVGCIVYGGASLFRAVMTIAQ